ncbi:MAG: hypothetical protein M1358_09970, partial [Chloroflexi bacterium]|nr:hypothetical protein [Chloroflexota bacterium]
MSRTLRAFVGLLASALLVGSLLAGCQTQTPTPAPPKAGESKTEAKPAEAKKAEAKPAAEAKPTAQANKPEAAKPVAMAQSVTIIMSQEPDTLLQGVGSMSVATEVKGAVGAEVQNAGSANLVWRTDKNEIIPGIAESVPTLENGGAKFSGEGVDKHL